MKLCILSSSILKEINHYVAILTLIYTRKSRPFAAPGMGFKEYRSRGPLPLYNVVVGSKNLIKHNAVYAPHP